ncbi:MAG: hypothetical protein GXY64_08495 [Bacteroidales bacterium]|nr:hypothetical protein [Bacteroidales bacterium]
MNLIVLEASPQHSSNTFGSAFGLHSKFLSVEELPATPNNFMRINNYL